MGNRIIAPIAVLLGLSIASVVLFITLPTAFLPQEDNGYFITSFSLPEGAVNVRTNAAIADYLKYMKEIPGVQETMGVTGFDILSGGQKPNAGLSFIKLKPWEERTDSSEQIDAVIAKAFAFNAIRKYLSWQ